MIINLPKTIIYMHIKKYFINEFKKLYIYISYKVFLSIKIYILFNFYCINLHKSIIQYLFLGKIMLY